MFRKWMAMLLVLCCLMGTLAGCVSVGEIADSVVSAAKAELEKQIQDKIQEYKVSVVEMKTAFGKLDGNGSYQFFCAVLVQSNSENSVSDCAKGMEKIAGVTGYMKQTTATVDSDHLQNKTVTYAHSDFSEDNYYTVYMYVADVTKIVDLKKDAA